MPEKSKPALTEAAPFPAMIPATWVPCPYGSPLDPDPVKSMLRSVRRRPPSLRSVSSGLTPESMTATATPMPLNPLIGARRWKEPHSDDSPL